MNSKVIGTKLCSGLLVCLLVLTLSAMPSMAAFGDESSTFENPVLNVQSEVENDDASDDDISNSVSFEVPTTPDYEDWQLLLLLTSNTTWGSQIREKGSSSSVYANITTMGTFAKLYVDAWVQQENVSTNATYNGEANLYSIGKYEIWNYVHEWKWPKCQITAWRSTGTAMYIEGLWSPDYTYEPGVTVLNGD
ncbi:MAG: hypothetical protein LBG81_08905 [Coriobacteriaceae bacterium]|jgi:hypothetical protein|nr:hypothetical protein [Coriobacteriaceae bacterium]